jgi:hypothetical protein
MSTAWPPKEEGGSCGLSFKLKTVLAPRCLAHLVWMRRCLARDWLRWAPRGRRATSKQILRQVAAERRTCTQDAQAACVRAFLAPHRRKLSTSSGVRLMGWPLLA